jgi:hypothetical protein
VYTKYQIQTHVEIGTLYRYVGNYELQNSCKLPRARRPDEGASEYIKNT